MIYNLSEELLNILSPRVPDNFMTRNGYEDSTTPRISFSSSIDGALMGISLRMTGKELYVYTIDEENTSIKIPNILEVPDVKITQEIWVLISITLKCIGKIKIIDDAGEPGLPYKYGNNTAELYKWNWAWI